ncbi:EipB family protein [Tepidamorphus sp. 3E244]|uniref:EipB family protein n=1 Tax=Tepidamorphus sp. 3E244 TaxID=3385498 RepID=UPI0038FC9176
MLSTRTCPIRLAPLALALLCPVPAQADLMPHRAVYDIKLERADEAGNIASFSGRMVVEVLATDCEGLATNSRYVFRSANSEGATLVTDLRTAQWESRDANTFRFTNRRYDDANLTEETNGNAERTGEGVEIAITMPQRNSLEFGEDVMFPTQHLNRLIQAGRTGQRTLSARIYEGSDPGTQIYDTFAVIGPKRLDRHGSGLARAKLEDVPHWPVTVAYFHGEGSENEDETVGGEEEPIYSISSTLYENGVSSDILLDYGNFSLRGNLSALTFPDQGRCSDR